MVAALFQAKTSHHLDRSSHVPFQKEARIRADIRGEIGVDAHGRVDVAVVTKRGEAATDQVVVVMCSRVVVAGHLLGLDPSRGEVVAISMSGASLDAGS